MAIQSFQLDPAAGGVSQAEFDTHTHPYRKLIRIGGDDDDKWSAPVWAVIADDSDTVAACPVDLEAVGVTVSTDQTGAPA